jgi:hypothetical protein
VLTMLRKLDLRRNLVRFYALSVQPNLFGPDP